MHILPLETGIIYGPILSRRLGLSLGVNLLPADCKLCSFDCVYCHYGRTDVKVLTAREGDFPSAERVLGEVEKALHLYPKVNALTFSGNGEPTLHPYFAAIAEGVRRLRDKLRPNVKLAIFSNSTTAHLPYIQETLALLDAPIMKLDAGDPVTLARINRPDPAVELAHILSGLKQIPNLITQSVLINGEINNIRGEAYEAWLAALGEVRPARVQIYSTDYPVPDAGVERVLPFTLKRIAADVESRTGLQVDAYWI